MRHIGDELKIDFYTLGMLKRAPSKYVHNKNIKYNLQRLI